MRSGGAAVVLQGSGASAEAAVQHEQSEGAARAAETQNALPEHTQGGGTISLTLTNVKHSQCSNERADLITDHPSHSHYLTKAEAMFKWTRR